MQPYHRHKTALALAEDAPEPPGATGQYPDPIWAERNYAETVETLAADEDNAPEPPGATGQYPDPVWAERAYDDEAHSLSADEDHVPEPPGATGHYPDPVWAERDSSAAALAADEDDAPEPPGATGQYPDPVWSETDYSATAQGLTARSLGFVSEALDSVQFHRAYGSKKIWGQHTVEQWMALLPPLKPSSRHGGTPRGNLTTAQLSTIMPRMASARDRLTRYTAALNEAFSLMGIDTMEGQALFLAHAVGESSQLHRFTESQEGDFVDANPRLNTTYLNEQYPRGGDSTERERRLKKVRQAINPLDDWDISFLGRGPLQVTLRDSYLRAAATMLKRAKDLEDNWDGDYDKLDDSSRLKDTVRALLEDPTRGSHPDHAFLLSAAFAKDPRGQFESSALRTINQNTEGSFKDVGGVANVWMSGGQVEDKQGAVKWKAYNRALDAMGGRPNPAALQAAAFAAEEDDAPEPPGATGQYPDPVWSETDYSATAQAYQAAAPPLEAPPPQAASPEAPPVVALDLQEMYRIVREVAVAESGEDLYAAIGGDQGEETGLAFGLLLFTQASGLLGAVLEKMHARDPALFAAVFGEAHATLRETTTEDTAAKRLQFVKEAPLWSPAWVERFQQAGAVPAFQASQNEVAIDRLFRPMTRVAFDLGLGTDRGMAMLYDRVVARGLDDGLRWSVEAASPLRTDDQHAEALRRLGFDDVAAFKASRGLLEAEPFGPRTRAALVAALRDQGTTPMPSPAAIMDRLVAAAEGNARHRLTRLRTSTNLEDIIFSRL